VVDRKNATNLEKYNSCLVNSQESNEDILRPPSSNMASQMDILICKRKVQEQNYERLTRTLKKEISSRDSDYDQN
jgi:hypothetical protein